MADGKKSIIVYADWIDKFECLSDDEAGRLIKHFFRYVNDFDPVAPDRLTEVSFVDIKQALKRDLKKWEVLKSHRSESGFIGNLKRWHPDLYSQLVEGEIDLDKAKIIANNRKQSQTDGSPTENVANIAVNVNGSVNATYNKYLGDELILLCMGNENWIEEVERIYKVDRTKILYALREFKSHRITIGKEETETLKDFKSHFTNWVRKKKQYQVKE